MTEGYWPGTYPSTMLRMVPLPLQGRNYEAGHSAPLAIQARVSSPNRACVPGRGLAARPGSSPSRPARRAHYARRSAPATCRRCGVRSLICAQIWPSDLPSHAIDRGREVPFRIAGDAAEAIGEGDVGGAVAGARTPGPATPCAVGPAEHGGFVRRGARRPGSGGRCAGGSSCSAGAGCTLPISLNSATERALGSAIFANSAASARPALSRCGACALTQAEPASARVAAPSASEAEPGDHA